MKIKQIRSVRLQFKEGTSNKEYIVVIEERLDEESNPVWRGVTVIAHWGKIGSELRSQAKFNKPFNFDNAREADEIANRLILSKAKKGYKVEDQAGVSAVGYYDMVQTQQKTTNAIVPSLSLRQKSKRAAAAAEKVKVPEPEPEEKHPLKRKDAFWSD